MDKYAISVKDTDQLPNSKVTVVNFVTDGVPSGTFCFGYMNKILYIGDIHHAIIMNWMIENGSSWEELMSADQRWGWVYRQYSEDDPIYDIRFATDDAKQTEGMGEEVRQVFEEWIRQEAHPDAEVKFENNNSEGYSSQDNYGQRARVQYQGEEDEYSEWCSYCEEYYNPDYEDHDHMEKCYNCGEYYGPDEAELHSEDQDNYCEVCGDYYSFCENFKHDENHPECEFCNEQYDENDVSQTEKHELPYCYDDDVHYKPEEAELHAFHHTSESGDAYRELPWGEETDYIKNYLHAAEKLYSQFIQNQQKTPIPEGLYPITPSATPRDLTIKALQAQYPISYEDAAGVVDMVEQQQGSQLKLFAAWREESATINRGIADASDRFVFAKLAAVSLTDQFDQQAWGEHHDKSKGGATYNPLNEDVELLDIEANPQSQEYRWSYDGYDLHIWEVTNRKMYGPSHYDMFGSEGYDEHSQGRIYVSPEGRVGSLYWQISHPETEQVIDQWIQANFNKPPDTVYRAYGPYKGYVTPRSYFPLVDVYNLPIAPKQRWWDQPDARPDRWYYDMGISPPSKKKRKQITDYPAKKQKTPKPNPAIQDEPSEWRDLSKRERRRLRRDRRNKQKGKGQGKPMGRGRGRRGNVIYYDYNPMPTVRRPFVITASGGFRFEDSSDSTGFVADEEIKMGKVTLQRGDIFFYGEPTPTQIKVAKYYLGDSNRVRWGSVCFDETDVL